MFLGLYPVISDKFTCDTNPGTFSKSTNFYFGILTQNITSGRGEKRGDRGKKRKEKEKWVGEKGW